MEVFVYGGEGMKVVILKKISHIIMNWRLGDYFRQLSIVVVGIVVTFWGSDLISNRSKQKEVCTTMQLVIEELKYNKLQLRNFEKAYEIDRRMAVQLVEKDFNCESIPMDTLQKYERFFSGIYTFSYTTDALEVLKNSSLMQQISDKRLLLDILHTYDKLKSTSAEVNSYCELKEEVLFSYSLSMNENERVLSNKNLKFWCEAYLSKEKVRNFCYLAPGYLDWDWCSAIEMSIDQCIHKLETRYN